MNIDELRKLMERATPGPWDGGYNAIHAGGCCVFMQGDNAAGIDFSDHDAALIVAAVNALPALLAVVEAAKNPDLDHGEHCRACCGPSGEGWLEEDKCSCGLRELRAALAKLEEA